MTDAKTPPDKSAKRPALPADLRHYYDLMLAEDLLELEIRDRDFYLRLSRQKAASAVAAPAAAHAAPAIPSAPVAMEAASQQDQLHSIASPLAGTFYRAPSPQSEAFVKEGDKVTLGAMLCIIEAMKVMNEIRADRPCVIRKILLENGKSVSAGQNLFLVDPL